MLEPIDALAVDRFLQSDVTHRGIRRSAVPMLLAGLEEDDIALFGFLDRTAPAFHPALAGDDDDVLANGMGMRCARLTENGMPDSHARRLVLREKGLHRDRAREPIGGADGTSLRTFAVEFHDP